MLNFRQPWEVLSLRGIEAHITEHLSSRPCDFENKLWHVNGMQGVMKPLGAAGVLAGLDTVTGNG